MLIRLGSASTNCSSLGYSLHINLLPSSSRSSARHTPTPFKSSIIFSSLQIPSFIIGASTRISLAPFTQLTSPHQFFIINRHSRHPPTSLFTPRIIIYSLSNEASRFSLYRLCIYHWLVGHGLSLHRDSGFVTYHWNFGSVFYLHHHPYISIHTHLQINNNCLSVFGECCYFRECCGN